MRHNLVMDNNDFPWVGFVDGANGNRATVMQFDGGSWTGVGAAGFSSSPAQFSFALSPTSTPYVAYSNSSSGTSRISVQKYDGTTWIFVGDTYIRQESDVSMDFPAIAIAPDGAPYVLYRHNQAGVHEQVASVMKYDGTTWAQVGIIGFSGSSGTHNIYDPFITVRADGVPVISYRDRGSPGFDRASVLYFDGVSWEPFGQLGLSEGGAMDVKVALDSKGWPWVSYKEQIYADSAVVKRFDGSSWLPVGAPAITDGSADFLHIAITSEDVPLIAYRQAGNSKPAVKMAESFLRYVVAENSSFSTTIGVFDVDGDTDFTFSLQGADSSFFTIGTSSGELTLNNPLNFEVPVDQNSDGAYTFEVRVSDASGAFITAPVRVFVEDVNEAPKLELYSDSGLSTPVTTWVIIEDWDSQAQQLYFVVNEEDGQSYTLTVLNAGETSFGNVWEYGPGVWELMGAQTFTPGTTSFTVEICDDSDPVLCNQVEIDIEAIEYQSPVITANPTSFNVFEGGSVNVPYEIQSFGPDFTFTVSVEPDYGFVTLDNTLSGVITYQSALEHTGVVTFTVEFNDGFESTSLEFTVMVQAPPPTMFEIGLDSTSLKLDVANQLYADYGYMGEPQSETWTLLEYPTGANTTDLQVDPVDGELATLTPTVPGRYRVRFDLMDEQSSSHFLEAEFITRDEWVAKPALAEEGFDGSLQMAGSANSIYARYMNASNELEVKKFDSVSWTESTLPYSSPAGMTVVGETVYIAYQYNSKIEIHRSNDNTAYEQVGQSLPYSTMVALGHNLSEDVFVCLQGGTLAVQCYKFDGNHWIKAGDEFAVATPTITYAQLISHENQMYYSAIHYSTLESRDIPVLYSYDGNAWNEETILVDPVITTTVLSYKAGFIGDQLWAMVAETDGIHIARHELGVGGMTPFDFSIPDLVHADMLVDNRGDIYLAYLHGSVSTDLAIKRFQIIENDWEDMTYPTDESMISINSGLVALARLSGVPHLAISDSSDSGILGFYALERTATPLVINHYPITMNSSVAGNEITLGFSKELPTTAHIGAVSLKNELNGDGFYNASITNTDGEAVLLLELTSNLEAGLRYTVEAGSTRVGGPAFIEDYQDINAPPFRFDFLTKAPYQILTGDMNREPSRNPSIAVAKQGNNLEIYVSAIEISSDLVTGTKYANGSWSHMETNISASAAVTSTPWIGIGLNKKPVITLRDTNHRIQAHAWTGSSWSNLVADQGSPDLFGDPSGHHVLASGFAPAVGLLPTHDYLYVMTRMTSSNGLKVASMANDGTWSLLGGTIDTVEGDDFAIAVGQDGNPVVVYRDYSNSDVQIKSWDGSSWSHVTASAPFGADSPNRMLQIEALGNGFIVVGGLDEVSNDFWLWAFDGSNWGDYEAPDQLVTQVHHYDMAFVDQTLFLVVSDANASTTIFYRRGTDSNWLEVNSFPRSDLESPRFGSDGKNLYLIGNDPIVDELLVYKLEPIDG
ncbi:MAG: cadherin repeat domain-containing protein [Candidatus Cloacimonetes bacterium]|nr:cadherin repeat domain-containing protein [Candidatus Cloacimonadota bacterium]